MKKLVTAVALCASTMVFAANPSATPAPHPANVPSHGPTTGVDATEVGHAPKEAAAKLGFATEEQGTFKVARAYDVEGILKNPAGGGITIERTGLPAVNLDVRDRTEVMLDGKKVAMNQLIEGQKIKAKFQVEGEEVVAVRLEASTIKNAKK